MDVVVCGLALLGVVGSVAVWLRYRPRDEGPRRDGLDIFRRWGVQVMYGCGFYVPLEALFPELPPTPVRELERLDAQLILAAAEDTTIILDCWVFPAPDSGTACEGVAVPITLRAHAAPGCTPPARIGAALTDWVTRGSTVDIRLTEEAGTALLRISDDNDAVSMAFDAAMS